MSRGFSLVTIAVVLIFAALSLAALLLLNEMANGSSLSTPVSLQENLVGWWGCTGKGAHSFEFDASGHYTTTGTLGSTKGTYRIKADNVIELDSLDDPKNPVLWKVHVKVNAFGIRVLETSTYHILWSRTDLDLRNNDNYPICR